MNLHQTPMEVVRACSDEMLDQLMDLCPVEPADPDKCVPCAAYMEMQARANPKSDG